MLADIHKIPTDGGGYVGNEGQSMHEKNEFCVRHIATNSFSKHMVFLASS
jgi:hypothetical protein